MAARRAPYASSHRRDQHFLRSRRLAAQIVDDARVGRDDLVLDLGAGTGALTQELVGRGARVLAVEVDPLLVRQLAERVAQARVVEGDARTVPLPREPFAVVANLPFGATTDILRRLLEPQVPLRRADVIVQWELALKRAAVWPSTSASTEPRGHATWTRTSGRRSTGTPSGGVCRVPRRHAPL